MLSRLQTANENLFVFVLGPGLISRPAMTSNILAMENIVTTNIVLIHWKVFCFFLSKGMDKIPMVFTTAFFNMVTYSYLPSSTCSVWNSSVMDNNIIGSNRKMTNNVRRENAIWKGTESQILIKHSLKHASMSIRMPVKDLKRCFDFKYFTPKVPILCLYCSKLHPPEAWIPAALIPQEQVITLHHT